MKRTRLLRKKRLRRIKPRPITDKLLDAACRAVVLERDGYKCIKCGGTDFLQAAHVYSRRYKSVRWSEQNVMTLCAGCHLHWHHQPVAAVKWWLEHVGEDYHFRLRGQLLSGQKVDRKETLERLRDRLKQLREGRDAA